MTESERKAFQAERYRYYRRGWWSSAADAYRDAKQDAARAEEFVSVKPHDSNNDYYGVNYTP
jgi:hypothetical protein